MCMEYVNGNIELCYDVKHIDGGKVGAYLNPFDEIAVDRNARGELVTPKFWAVVRVNIIGTADEKKKLNNPIERGARLGFRLNLTKCCTQKSGENNSVVLNMFELDLSKIKLNHACFSYVNHTQLVEVPSLCLPGDHGGYAVKLVVREMEPGEDLSTMRASGSFTVQAIASLHFKPRRESLTEA